ncbi:hypothetical protein DP57_6112 [Burkholderia pseudomallei]|nr:hypothetical protein DP57_6112 [Burkholderia pseudomallei]
MGCRQYSFTSRAYAFPRAQPKEDTATQRASSAGVLNLS